MPHRYGDDEPPPTPTVTLPPTFTTVVDVESDPEPPEPNANPNAIPTPKTTAHPATPRAWLRSQADDRRGHDAAAQPRPSCSPVWP
jgi:hypothetical protein